MNRWLIYTQSKKTGNMKFLEAVYFDKSCSLEYVKDSMIREGYPLDIHVIPG